jgi:hypothetical protein
MYLRFKLKALALMLVAVACPYVGADVYICIRVYNGANVGQTIVLGMIMYLMYHVLHEAGVLGSANYF